MSVINLGRTTKTNIVFYSTDGMGRDGYITYNNGGFWKKNIKQISLKPDFPKNSKKIFHSLYHQPAPFNYQSDGSGRDSYVIENNAGLVKRFEPLIKQKLTKYLRKEDDIIKRKVFLTKSQKKVLNKMKMIQKNVVNRLYNVSLEKIKNNKLKLKTKSMSDFFDENKIKKNFQSISPIKNNKDKDDNSLNKKSIENYNYYNYNYNKNNNKFLNPSKEKGQKNLFDRVLKNRNIYKNNSMKNIPYFDKRDNTGKVKVLKNLNINSYYNSSNFKDNKTANSIKKKDEAIKYYKIDNIKKNSFNKKNYNVVVSPYDFRMKKNFMTTNNMNNTTSNSNFSNNFNTINNNEHNYNYNCNVDNQKYEEELDDVKNNKIDKNENFKNFNKTQIFSKPKPFLVDNYNDYRENYGKYLKNKKLNFYY
jgi:hypothetical protein